MAGLNKIFLIGNLGNDPEMRFTPEGKAVTSFSLAVTESKSDTIWFRVTAWEGLAEKVNQFLTKGRQVYVEGRLRLREWEGQDGKKHTSLEVTANKVIFLGTKPSEGKSEEAAEVEDTPFI